jgi:hypothetical protein
MCHLPPHKQCEATAPMQTTAVIGKLNKLFVASRKNVRKAHRKSFNSVIVFANDGKRADKRDAQFAEIGHKRP